MNTLIKCPVCDKIIPFWQIVVAGTPTRIKCSECKSRLRPSGTIWRLYLIDALLWMIIGGGAFITFFLLENSCGAISAGVLAVIVFSLLWVACYLPFSLHIVKQRKLKIVSRKNQQKNSMKFQISNSLLALFTLMGLVLFKTTSRPTIDPSDMVYYLVNSGIEFSENQMDVDLLKNRKLVITTQINAITAQRIIKSLLLLDTIDNTAPIDLYIRTQGGFVDDAFGIIDIMEYISAPVNTHAIGGTKSAGAMILAAGTGLRFAYPYSSIMFHAGLYEDDAAEYSSDKLGNNRLTGFWERHAHIPSEWLTEETDKYLYLSPEEALKWGLIDQIKTNANPIRVELPARRIKRRSM